MPVPHAGEPMSTAADEKPLRVLIAGASGLMGGALVPWLRGRGHTVMRLVRRAAVAADETSWNPAAGELDPGALTGVDAVLNLAGENLAAGRWTARRRTAIRASRLQATDTLVTAIRKSRQPPRVLLSASAVGYYGDRGDEVLTEQSAPGTGFLAEVCRSWEAQAQAAAQAGVRTCALRFGMVLNPRGGALAKMLPVFRLGLGGPVSTGAQWMSWISLEDVVGVIGHALADTECRAAVNATAPEPVSNAEFTRELGRALHRPAMLRVPAFALRAVFGEMADATLLASLRAVPQRLLARGYRFQHPTLETWFRAHFPG